MTNIKGRLVFYSLLAIAVLATGLFINRPASGTLEAVEISDSDRNAPTTESDRTSTEVSHSVILKNRSISRTFSVELAETVAEQSSGLSDRDRLENDRGMLFVFDPPSEPSFWMRGMRFNLDILWIANDRIIKIDRNLPAPDRPDRPDRQDAAVNLPTYQPPRSVDYVLEINAGQSAEFSVNDSVTVITSQLD